MKNNNYWKLYIWNIHDFGKPKWQEFVFEHAKSLTKPVVGYIALHIMEKKIKGVTNSYSIIVNITPKDICILENESIIHIKRKDKQDWLFCGIDTRFEKQSFAITGCTTLPRNIYKSLIELNGGIYHEKVSKNTTYLINLAPMPTKKLKKAKLHGIQLINEIQFFKMLA